MDISFIDNNEKLPPNLPASEGWSRHGIIKGGMVIGNIIYNLKTGFIDHLTVNKEERCKGYGATILKHVESVVRDAGCRVLMVLLLSNTEDFYVKQGYIILHRTSQTIQPRSIALKYL